MHRIIGSMRLVRLTPLAQGLCIVTLALLLVLPEHGAVSVAVPYVLLLLQGSCVLIVCARAARDSSGTRRTLYAALAAAAALAVAAGCSWAMGTLLFGATHPSVADACVGLGAQLAIMFGFATALGRARHRNWMHFEAVVDAMVLVVAAAIVIVQLGYMPSGAGRAGLAARALSLVWNTVAAGNLILVALLLAWRGEALGPQLAVSLSLGTSALAIANLLIGRATVPAAVLVSTPIVALWTITAFCWITAAGTVHAEPARSGELPAYRRNAATIRTLSIVVAILISAGSVLAMALRHDHHVALGVALSVFGVLLAVRAGQALWAQQRTTTVLEHTVLAERELSVTLERLVADRTRDVAEAQRVLQRMWTLGQQVALELTPDRVLRSYLDAVVDVARADGGAIALLGGDACVTIVATTGLGEVLAGADVPLPASLIGRVVRRGTSWSASELPAGEEGAGPDRDLLAGAGAHGIAIVPLQGRGELVGAAVLLARAGHAFTERTLAHIEAMSDLVSVALANAELVETLRQTEWRFRTLFRAAPDAVLTMFENGRIREANDAVRDLVGLPPVQLAGRAIDEFVVPEDRERLRAELARALTGHGARIEVRFQHEAGVRLGSLAVRRLPEADPPMVLVVGRDTTAEREMRARLAETERLAAVGELVAGVAHEVNNPLSTISAFAQLLLRDGQLAAQQRESVEVIRSETMRASLVLRDLLTFARRSESQPGPLDVNEVVERTVRLRSYEIASHGVTCTTALAAGLPPVTGDARQLQQVVLNLVTNAIQAMAPRGTGALHIATRAEGSRVVLDVADTGAGIAPDVRAHVFEPFYTTKRDGTGLGLSVSYGIVATHGGTITIAQTSSRGTTFRVTLPADAPETPSGGAIRLGEASRRAETSALAGLRVLFVDDEPTLRSGMQAFGRLRGCTVVTATDGATALKTARQEHFDAIVCDLRMPVMDGPAFYEVLRRERPEMAARTLFITGDLVSVGSRAFLDATTQPVLSKPFEFEELEATIRALVGEATAVACEAMRAGGAGVPGA